MPPERSSGTNTGKHSEASDAHYAAGKDCNRPTVKARPWTPAAPRNQGFGSSRPFSANSGDNQNLLCKPKLRLPALRPITTSLLDPHTLPSSEISSHRCSYNLSTESKVLHHGPFDQSALAGHLRHRAATAPDAPSVSMMSPYLHDGAGQAVLSSSLSTCENFSSINQMNDVHRSFSSDRTLSQGHLRVMDGPDAWIHDADLSPSDPLFQWYNKTNRSTEWRDRVDRILRQIMSKDLRQQTQCDDEANDRLRDAVKQVLDHLNTLKLELEQTNLQEGLLQMPSDAFRNRNDSIDCDSALGPPSCESEHLPISQCIQEVLFRLLDLHQPHIQFRVATICLAMAPSPNTALDMARVLYQLSKDASNDPLFSERGLVPAVIKYLRQTSKNGSARGTSHDAAVLLVAVLKNATLDPDNRLRVARANGPLVLSYLLRSEAVQPDSASAGTSVQDEAAITLAVQAIGVVRNLAASQELLQTLRDGDTLKGLRGALALCGRESDVAFGVARVLCKISLDPRTVMDTMAQPDLLRAFIRMAILYVDQPAINLRFTYAFGNLVSQSQDNATSLTMVEGVIDYLEQSMQATIRFVEADYDYGLRAPDENHRTPMPDSATPDEAASAIGYFAANVCTTAEAAAPIARRKDIAHASARLLMLCNKAAFYDASSHLAEFIRNITFYDHVSVLPDFDTPEAGGSAFLSLPPEVILRPVIPMMLSPAPDTAAAAAGAVGNLMRIPRAREYACKSCADEGLVLLLGSQNVSVVRAAAGALVNLACDCAGCIKLAELGVGSAVAEALISSLGLAMADVESHTAACHTVCNHRVRKKKQRDLIVEGVKECEELLQLLCCLLKWHVGADRSSRPQEGSPGAAVQGLETASMAGPEGKTGCATDTGRRHQADDGAVSADEISACEYDLGEAFWQEASAVLHWLETFARMVDECEQGGQVLYKAKEALSVLMEDVDDREGDAVQTADKSDGHLSCSSQKQGDGLEKSMFPTKASVAVSSSS